MSQTTQSATIIILPTIQKRLLLDRPYDYIKDRAHLRDYVAQTQGTPILAIDTEFIREKTYWPNLCLIQLATEEHTALVDPLLVDDLSPLQELFADQQTVKVFHSGDQDLEIIYQRLHMLPSPVFDTQLAAEILGMSQQVSLLVLVNDYCGVNLDKADSFTDWNVRPLSDSQISYAVDDVRYLPQIYKDMRARLCAMDRLSWLEEDFREMCDESRYIVDPNQAWQRVKRSSTITGQRLGVLRELAFTRETIAMRRNLPRKWIATDELLIAIARLCPLSIEELHHLRGAQNQLGHNWGMEIIKAVKRGLALPSQQLPQRGGTAFKTASYAPSIDLMRTLLRWRAKQNHITQAMLANKEDLVKLAAGQRHGIKVLSGWRNKLVGQELLDLLDGKLSLHMDGGQLVVTQRLC
ncbi:MAG: ribonuclease D [Coriobacteriales bacterium]|jgi:ribonuclease D|nr:ribonuclease D [Coriobacteriales bacterium]